MPFTYPTSATMDMIQPDLMMRGRAGRLGLDIMPIKNRNAGKVRWNQKDNYFGLQQFRGLDGQPLHVIRIGSNTYEYEPGIFGEYIDITETELVSRAGSVDVLATPIDVGDLIQEGEEQLIGRELDRVESSIWTLLTTGTLTIRMDGNTFGQQVAYNDSYTVQTYSPQYPWSNLANATPIRDSQYIQQQGFAAGHSVDFGGAAIMYMNQFTANNMLNNQNTADLYGRKLAIGATINDIADIKGYWAGQNLPRIQVYDDGYQTGPLKSGGVFKKYIPNGTAVVIGVRPGGVPIGEYQMTRNASNGYKPGSYRYVIDRANGGGSGNAEKRTPANIEIHRGHNGGPAIYYPSAVLIMSGL